MMTRTPIEGKEEEEGEGLKGTNKSEKHEEFTDIRRRFATIDAEHEKFHKHLMRFLVTTIMR